MPSPVPGVCSAASGSQCYHHWHDCSFVCYIRSLCMCLLMVSGTRHPNPAHHPRARTRRVRLAILQHYTTSQRRINTWVQTGPCRVAWKLLGARQAVDRTCLWFALVMEETLAVTCSCLSSSDGRYTKGKHNCMGLSADGQITLLHGARSQLAEVVNARTHEWCCQRPLCGEHADSGDMPLT